MIHVYVEFGVTWKSRVPDYVEQAAIVHLTTGYFYILSLIQSI